jgi:hypothetical protein
MVLLVHLAADRNFFVLFSVGMVYSAETLNDVAREHWQLFASQLYFDKSGVFTSFLFSLPLILIASFILVLLQFSSNRRRQCVVI